MARGVVPRLVSGVFRRCRRLQGKKGGGTHIDGSDANNGNGNGDEGGDRDGGQGGVGDVQVEVLLSYYQINQDDGSVFDLLAPAGSEQASLHSDVVMPTERRCESMRDFEALYDAANAKRAILEKGSIVRAQRNVNGPGGVGGSRSHSNSGLDSHARAHVVLGVRLVLSTGKRTRVGMATAVEMAGTGFGTDLAGDGVGDMCRMLACLPSVRQSSSSRNRSKKGLTLLIVNLAASACVSSTPAHHRGAIDVYRALPDSVPTPASAHHPQHQHHFHQFPGPFQPRQSIPSERNATNPAATSTVATATPSADNDDIENDPVFKGPPRGPSSSSTHQACHRQPLRQLATSSTNVNLPVTPRAGLGVGRRPSAEGDGAKTGTGGGERKPAKAFAVYADHRSPRSPGPGARQGADGGLLKTPRALDAAASPRMARGTKTPEKCSSKLLQLVQTKTQAQPQLRTTTPTVSRQQPSADGLAYLQQARQHRVCGDMVAALQAYRLARPFFPHNEKLRRRIAAVEEDMGLSQGGEGQDMEHGVEAGIEDTHEVGMLRDHERRRQPFKKRKVAVADSHHHQDQAVPFPSLSPSKVLNPDQTSHNQKKPYVPGTILIDHKPGSAPHSDFGPVPVSPRAAHMLSAVRIRKTKAARGNVGGGLRSVHGGGVKGFARGRGIGGEGVVKGLQV